MAVFFYGPGEHPAGFIGYRVATTLGSNSEFRQKYFSLNQYGATTAESKAHKLDEEWRGQAKDNRRSNRLKGAKSNAGPGAITAGLSALFKVERGRREGYGTYVTPVFAVQLPVHEKGAKRFSIRKHGLDQAYEMAVSCYGQVNGLSDPERKYLLTLKPEPKLFTHTLRQGLLMRGLAVTEAAVIDMLNEHSQRTPYCA